MSKLEESILKYAVSLTVLVIIYSDILILLNQKKSITNK